MTYLSELYLVAVLMLAALSVFFIFCRHYEDGLVGCAALGVVFLFALVELSDMYEKTWTAPSPAQRILVIAIAVFMARYAAKVIWMNWMERLGFVPARERGAALVTWVGAIAAVGVFLAVLLLVHDAKGASAPTPPALEDLGVTFLCMPDRICYVAEDQVDRLVRAYNLMLAERKASARSGQCM